MRPSSLRPSALTHASVGRISLRPPRTEVPAFPETTPRWPHSPGRSARRADIAEATDAVNRRQVDILGEKVTACVSPGETVGILGLSYKAGTM